MDQPHSHRGSVRFDARRTAPTGDGVVASLSSEALRLHVFAVLASIEAGVAGFVGDGYLSAVRAETTLSVLELTTCGLWERGDGGYQVAEDETIRMATEVHRQLTALSAGCRARGGHVADPEHPDACAGCGVRLTP